MDLNVRPLSLLIPYPSFVKRFSHRCEPSDLLLQDALDKIVPEGHHYRHLDEGLDDMPAHVKVNCHSLAVPHPVSPCSTGLLVLILQTDRSLFFAVFSHGSKPDSPNPARPPRYWYMARCAFHNHCVDDCIPALYKVECLEARLSQAGTSS